LKRAIPHLPDAFEVAVGQGCMGQSDSLDTPVESDESYEASEALLDAAFAQASAAKTLITTN
jgi:hypothetical protein